MLSTVCSAGGCLVPPPCNEQRERCDPEGCASRCGNPFANGDDADTLMLLRQVVGLGDLFVYPESAEPETTTTTNPITTMPAESG